MENQRFVFVGFRCVFDKTGFRGATVARKPNTLEVARSTLAGINSFCSSFLFYQDQTEKRAVKYRTQGQHSFKFVQLNQ